MTDREKIAHLLRRLGFGASREELAQYEPLGVQGTIDRLIDYDKVDEGFPISPWQICFEEGKTEVYLDPYRIAAWWSLRMLMSQRPLEQKLTLFWHNHFAVGADKVELGPVMLDYLETLRRNAAGTFETLLVEVSKEPAMMKYLDTESNIAGHVNENFARELFELFTMGPGHYTETDIKEAARAFTGWTTRNLLYEPGYEKIQETAKIMIKNGTPMFAFCNTPSVHDRGQKTILGQTSDMDGEGVLKMVAQKVETAHFISKKLWKYFANENPSEATLNKLSSTFMESNGNIRTVLKAIVADPDFWSEASVRKLVKSPADLVIPYVRQLNVYAILLQLEGKPASVTTPMPTNVRGTCQLLSGSMYQMGMLPLFPPNVGGWNWGTAWITPNNMLQRTKFSDLIMGVGQPDAALANYLAAQILARKPANSAAVIDDVLTTFDAVLPDEKKAILVSALDKAGGAANMTTPKGASKTLGDVMRLLTSSPEFQHF